PATHTQSGPAGRPYRAAIAGVIVCAMGVAAWLIVRTHAAHTTRATTPVPLVTVVTPKFGEVLASVSLTGLISARNDMPIGTEGDVGRISAVLAEAGDRVRKG